MVLFLVGLECLVLLSAHELMRHVKENVVLSIVLKENNTADEVERTKRLLNALRCFLPCCEGHGLQEGHYIHS